MMTIEHDPRKFKDAVYEQLARLGKSLSSGPRLEIVDLLCQAPHTVEALAGQVGQSVANTSRHLQVLRRARLVEAEKHGVHVRYRIADDDVCLFFHAMRKLAEARLLEVDQLTDAFFGGREGVEPVGTARLLERVQLEEVLLLDVRPAEEFAAGHIPGAVSIPSTELASRLAELPRDREIVAYCRGPYCVMAVDAATLLRAEGFHATHSGEGVLDWRAGGRAIETPPAGQPS